MRKVRMHPFVQFLGLIVLCLALGSGTALANHESWHKMEGHHGYSHHGHGGMWGKDMFAYVPMGILHQKDLLGLSDEQVQKIQTIKEEMWKVAGGSHETIEQIHEQMASAFTGGQFDLSTYESALKKAAEYAVQARLETARKAQEALQVLDQDQRTRFLYSVELVHSWMESHGMGHHHWMKHHKYGMDDHHDMNGHHMGNHHMGDMDEMDNMEDVE